MALEIERKFLVTGDEWRNAEGVVLRQGYLSTQPERTVRVRTEGDKAKLTIKGITRGATRAEYEYDIPPEDAAELLRLCEPPLIEKVRRRLEHDGLVWEVDEFLGDNQGLVIAEVELDREDRPLTKPPWVGKRSPTTPASTTPTLWQIPSPSGTIPISAPDSGERRNFPNTEGWPSGLRHRS